MLETVWLVGLWFTWMGGANGFAPAIPYRDLGSQTIAPSGARRVPPPKLLDHTNLGSQISSAAVDTPEPPHNQMTMDDVVKMSKNGIARKIIIRQMETTGATFQLTADDIISLHKQGVSNRIIFDMQQRRISPDNVMPKSPRVPSPADGGNSSVEPKARLVRNVLAWWGNRLHMKADPGRNVNVLAWWDDHLHFKADPARSGVPLPGLAGRAYFFGDDSKQMGEVNGKVVVEMYDMTPTTIGGQPNKLVAVTYDANTLKRLKCKDQVGDGYTLFIPWEAYDPAVKEVKLDFAYLPDKGSPYHPDPVWVNLKSVPK